MSAGSVCNMSGLQLIVAAPKMPASNRNTGQLFVVSYEQRRVRRDPPYCTGHPLAASLVGHLCRSGLIPSWT